MPNAEILSIGTELLLGQIVNTNARFLAEQLAIIGMDCFFQTTVGDNPARLRDCLMTALERSDVVLTTGGLGPTSDDITHETMADLFGAEMVPDQKELDRITAFFKARGIEMPASNRKQAFRPRGATLLPNPSGTASGIIWELDADALAAAGIETAGKSRVILTFPGVPPEMESMWFQTAHGYLSERFPSGSVWSCELKHYGIGESALAEKYEDLLSLENPTVAPLAGTGECRLRVTAKAATADDARALAQPVIDRIRRESGQLCYGHDKDTLEAVTGELLARDNRTVAVVESCTGGLVSKRLTDVPGSSRYISLNAVTYSNEAKQRLLGVSPEILERHGAVSHECAQAMATGIRELSRADVGLSITGIAGPEGGSPEKPVGLVYIGLATADFVTVKRMTYPPAASRSQIRHRSASDAINLLRLFLLNRAYVDDTARV